MEGRQFSHNDAEANEEGTEMFFQKRRCCFCIPYYTPSSSDRSAGHSRFNLWHRMRAAETGNGSTIWSRGVTALMKIREWSEIVAGPRWKTFIRRFNRSKSQSGRCQKFQYDPLSYAMNFDEGPGQNGNFEEEEEHVLRNFSVRYASIPGSAKSSMDLGKDGGGPSFV